MHSNGRVVATEPAWPAKHKIFTFLDLYRKSLLSSAIKKRQGKEVKEEEKKEEKEEEEDEKKKTFHKQIKIFWNKLCREKIFIRRKKIELKLRDYFPFL